MPRKRDMKKQAAWTAANKQKRGIKRLSIEVLPERKEEIRAAAEEAGESLQHYVLTAVDRRMKEEKE